MWVACCFHSDRRGAAGRTLRKAKDCGLALCPYKLHYLCASCRRLSLGARQKLSYPNKNTSQINQDNYILLPETFDLLGALFQNLDQPLETLTINPIPPPLTDDNVLVKLPRKRGRPHKEDSDLAVATQKSKARFCAKKFSAKLKELINKFEIENRCSLQYTLQAELTFQKISRRISLNNVPTLMEDLRGIFCRRLAYLKVKYLISDETMQKLLGHAQGINFEVKSHSVKDDLREINTLMSSKISITSNTEDECLEYSIIDIKQLLEYLFEIDEYKCMLKEDTNEFEVRISGDGRKSSKACHFVLFSLTVLTKVTKKDLYPEDDEMEIDNVEGARELEVEETSTQLCDIQSLQQRAMETLGREEWGKFTVDSHLKHDDVVDTPVKDDTVFCSYYTAEDCLSIAVYEGKEKREHLEIIFPKIIKQLRSLKQSGITVHGKKVKFKFIFASDWKFLALTLGLNAANSNYFCCWCTCCKDGSVVSTEIWKKDGFLRDLIKSNKNRVLKCLACFNSGDCGSNHGVTGTNLLEEDVFDDIVLDNLHSRLRTSDIVEGGIVEEISHFKGMEKKLEDECKRANIPWHAEAYEKESASAKWSCTLNGDKKRRLWTHLNLRNIFQPSKKEIEDYNNAKKASKVKDSDILINGFYKMLPEERIMKWEKLMWLSAAIDEFLSCEHSHVLEEFECGCFFTSLKSFEAGVSLFGSLAGELRRNSHKGNTPYVHSLKYHVSDMIKNNGGSIARFSTSSQELQNSQQTLAQFRSTNQKNVTLALLQRQSKLLYFRATKYHLQQVGKQQRRPKIDYLPYE